MEVEQGPDFIEVRQVRENSPVGLFVLAATTVAFGLVIALVLPAMRVSSTANGAWITGGLIALAAIGGAVYARTRTATLRLDAAGIAIEQGTPIDLTRAAVGWDDLASVEVEAVDEASAKRGVVLRLSRKDGARPIDAMPGVAVAELTDVRRLVIETWRTMRPDAAG